MKREIEVNSLEQMCDLMCGGAEVDDLIIHKLAKANIDAKEKIDNILYSLHMMENDGQEKVTILSVEVALENLKKILEVQNEGKAK